MRVQLLLVYAILPIATAMIVSTPGLQRTNVGNRLYLIWTVNRTVTSFNLFNSSGSIINPNTTVQHIDTSFIFMAILTVQLSDAGNYTLQVNFAGDPSPTIDTTACIYFYYSPTVTLVQTPVTTTVNEGSLAMYSCSGAVSSLSLPAQYRPNPSTLVYTFSISNLGTLRRQLDGSVIGSGQVIDRRYTLIDNQTLRINPVKSSDNRQYVSCTVCDSYSCGSNGLYIYVANYRPFLTNAVTPYKRYAKAIGTSVSFYVEYTADPAISSYSWSFSNVETGPFMPLPTSWTTTIANTTVYEQLYFSITSSAQYGFYLLTLTNNVGTSDAKFQLIAQGVPPDQPSLVKPFVTSSSVNLQWNSGWDNGRQQYFRVSLNDPKQNITIDQQVKFGNSYSSSSINCVSIDYNIYPYYYYYYYPTNPIYSSYSSYFNCTYVVNFTSNIYPETDYEVFLWAVNEFGSSDVVRSTTTTPAYKQTRPKLVVSADSIFIFGNKSVINFSVENGIAAYMSVECYELNTMIATYASFNINASTHQVNMTVQVGSMYRFNFRLYANNVGLVDYQTTFFPAETTQSPATNADCTMTSVIILAVLLGVAVIVGLVELIWILNNRCHSNKKNDSLKELSQVSTVSDRVGVEKYTDGSFYTSLTDRTRGSIMEGYYEDIQKDEKDTRAKPRKALPLPHPSAND